MKVGYIGLGSMGGDQVRRIAKSDLDLTVYDVSEKAREEFSKTTRVAGSLAEAVCGADVIQICVRDIQQVNDVLFGAGGLAAHAKANAVIVVHSTIAAVDLEAIAHRLADRGLKVCDAPVTRTSMDADGRFVLTMVGGDAESFERIRPVLECFSTDVLHVGRAGSAMALKMVNNMMTWSQLVIGHLTWRLASAYDISFEHLKRVTKANGNLTMVTEAFLSGASNEDLMKDPDRRSFLESQAGIGDKDLGLAIAAGRAASMDMRMIEVARQLLPEAMLGPQN